MTRPDIKPDHSLICATVKGRPGYQPTTARRRPPPKETAQSVVRTFTFPGVCSTDCYPVAISVPRIAAIHGEFAA